MYAPHSGHGLHDFILNYTAREILGGASPEDVRLRTWQLTQDKGRPHSVLAKEIDDAIDGATEWLRKHPGVNVPANQRQGTVLHRAWEWQDRNHDLGIRRPPPWDKWVRPLDKRLVQRILRHPPPKLKPRKSFELGSLFAEYDFVLCLAPEVDRPQARWLSYWDRHDLSRMQWMVPNPCIRCGDGGEVKTDDNAGERIWVIVEFDQRTLEEQTKLLSWLERSQPEWDLSMIVYSGGKSLHGWFSCVGMTEHQEIIRFFQVATSIGCDKMMRSSVQYTRFPLGTNTKTKRRQEIIHWNDEAIAFHNENLVRREREDE